MRIFNEEVMRMAGHSKWNNIKQRKGAQDAKRGKIFQKLSKEIYQAAKDGGPDVEDNAALRSAIEDARAQNMPKENIDRAIDKATNAGAGEDYHPVLYEGYGPKGVAILVDGLTDNANRTSANVRAAFTKNESNLGTKGSVSYMFDQKGYFAVLRDELDVDEDTMLMSALDAGAEDIETSDEVFEIYSDPKDFAKVRNALQEEGYKFEEAQLTYVPQNTLEIDEETQKTIEKLIEVLEDDDDVNEVYHNAELS